MKSIFPNSYVWHNYLWVWKVNWLIHLCIQGSTTVPFTKHMLRDQRTFSFAFFIKSLRKSMPSFNIFGKILGGKNGWGHGMLKGHESQPESSLNGQAKTIWATKQIDQSSSLDSINTCRRNKRNKKSPDHHINNCCSKDLLMNTKTIEWNSGEIGYLHGLKVCPSKYYFGGFKISPQILWILLPPRKWSLIPFPLSMGCTWWLVSNK